jgi:hypothetical protein
MAIDEQRTDFELCAFTKDDDGFPRLATPEAMPDGTMQVIQQVWFAGAHADVGGGYSPVALSVYARPASLGSWLGALWRKVARVAEDGAQARVDGDGPRVDERAPRDMANVALFWMEELAFRAGLTLVGTQRPGEPADVAAPFGTKRAARPPQAKLGAAGGLFAQRLRLIDVTPQRSLWSAPHDSVEGVWTARGRRLRTVMAVPGAAMLAPAVTVKYGMPAPPAHTGDPAPVFALPAAHDGRAPGQYTPPNTFCIDPMPLELMVRRMAELNERAPAELAAVQAPLAVPTASASAAATGTHAAGLRAAPVRGATPAGEEAPQKLQQLAARRPK